MSLKNPSLFLVFTLCIVIATVAVYLQCWRHDFINFDDPGYVTENIHVKKGLNWENVLWAFTTFDQSNWHPLTWLSHMADCELFGLAPGPHHMVNVLLHLLNTVGLFYVFYRMTNRLWTTAFIASLFALHPLHIESVAWISERKDVLSTFFWILTMILYLGYIRCPQRKRYWLVIVCYALGLMAKPMLVTLPVVLILLDFWPLGRFQPAGPAGKIAYYHLIVEKIPLFILAALASIVTFIAQREGGSVATIDQIPLLTRLSNVFVSYSAYIFKMFRPLNLAVFYPYPAYGVPLRQGLVCFAVILCTTIAAVCLIRTMPWVFTGWFWYIITLLPVIGLVQIGAQARADRYTYIPLIGLFIIIAWTARELLCRHRFLKPVFGICAILVIVLLAICSRRYLEKWHDNSTLLEHALTVAGPSTTIHGNLGSTYLKAGKIEQAVKHLHAALRIKQNDFRAHDALALALSRQGRIDEAVSHWNEAIAANPSYVAAYNNLAVAYAEHGRTDEAIACYRKALEINPDLPEARNNLGNALLSQGKTDQAVAEYKIAIDLDPGYARAHYNLAIVLEKVGKTEEAIAHYRRAIALKVDYISARHNLGNCLAAAGELTEAIQQFEAILNAGNDDAQIHYKLGVLYDRIGKIYPALEHLNRALQIDPSDKKAAEELARIKKRFESE
ncbi:MAG: tetratricopeptide repeat protein [Planctomycetota bacterium]